MYPSMLRVDVLDFSLLWQKHPNYQPEGRSIYFDSCFQGLQSRSSSLHVSAPVMNQDIMVEGSSSAHNDKEAERIPVPRDFIIFPSFIQSSPCIFDGPLILRVILLSLINHLCKHPQSYTQKSISPKSFSISPSWQLSLLIYPLSTWHPNRLP